MRVLLFLPLLAGCEIATGDCTVPTQNWTTPGHLHYVAADAVGTLLASIAPDETLDGMTVATLSLARISAASGQVLAIAPLTMGPPRAVTVQSDDAGGGLLVGVDGNQLVLVRFDATLAPTWTRRMLPSAPADAGPLGDTAYISEGQLHYIDAAGVEAWSVPEATGYVRLGWQGDVFVMDGFPTKRRHYDNGGLLLDEVQLDVPINDVWFARDGSATFLDGSTHSLVGRTDPSGAVLWRSDLHAVTYTAEAPIVSSTGQLLVLVDMANRVVRLDGTSGAQVAIHDNCHADPANSVFREILFADDDSYVLFDQNGLTQFVGP